MTFLPRLVISSLAFIAALGVFAPQADAADPRKATFLVHSRLAVPVPENAIRVRIWMPMPQQDAAGEIENLTTEVQLNASAAAAKDKGAKDAKAPVPAADADKAAGDAPAAPAVAAKTPTMTVARDSHGNEIGYVELSRPRGGEVVVDQTFKLTRSEVLGDLDPAKTRALNAKEKEQHRAELEASTYIQLTPEIKKLAGTIVGTEKNPAVITRKIYDWIVQNVDYWAKDPKRYEPSPMGSAVYSLSTRSGNCADMHSLYIALARAAGIPARMVYGSLLKKNQQGSREDAGTHCWAEVWLPDLGWQSIDVSLGDLYDGSIEKTDDNKKLLTAATPDGLFGSNPAMMTYYYGNLEERRLVWSRGRDLMLEPAQGGVALNSLPKAYVEIDGKEHGGWTRTTTFTEEGAATENKAK